MAVFAMGLMLPACPELRGQLSCQSHLWAGLAAGLICVERGDALLLREQNAEWIIGMIDADAKKFYSDAWEPLLPTPCRVEKRKNRRITNELPCSRRDESHLVGWLALDALVIIRGDGKEEGHS